MIYATFSLDSDSTRRLGVVRGDQVLDVESLAASSGEPLPNTLLDLIRSGPAEWQRTSALVRASAGTRAAAWSPLHAVRLYAPIPRPTKNIFCVGLNYSLHAAESARFHNRALQLPEVPLFFTKAPTTVSGPHDDIPWDPTVTQQVDWEAELGVIIGIAGRNIRRDVALQHVFGYTIVNDVSARDLQKSHGQFFKGKSLDGFCPMGPFVVTSDEFGNPQDKEVVLRVNGVVKQQGNTRDMIFTIAALIESLSRGLTLEPGDIIATGTPEGVGAGRTPSEFLQHGDVMETEIEGIGTMRNRIIAMSPQESPLTLMYDEGQR